MFTDYNAAKDFIKSSEKIDYQESFALSQYCSKLLRTDEKLGRDIVIRVQDAWGKVSTETHQIWNDLTEAAGLYPYVDPELLSSSSLLRYEYHKSPFLENVYLHQDQLAISFDLVSKKSVVVSAPTSFGKSLLIEEIVSSGIYNQLVIIQPTLALLDETRKKLVKYNDQYKVVVSTAQEPSEQKGNIFLFTAERVVEYKNFPKIEFFVIDEFYKLSLSRDDDRAIALNQAFNKLLKYTSKFYLLGPMIKDIPLNFKKKFELTWFPSEFATVAVDEESITIEGKTKEKNRLKREKLFQILLDANEPTLIYCSSPNKATQLAFEFTFFLKSKELSFQKDITDNIKLAEWINNHVNPNWTLIDSLKLGIAIHHGALPRHMGSYIVDLFNKKSVQYLFCTSTLIEGVNTSAKNVILFDKQKGTKAIDFFDYKNIAGRSGRMNQHFIGNVIRLEEEPQQMELFVDIPLFNQEEAPLEILVSIDDEDLEDAGKKRLEKFNEYPKELQELLKLNTGISIEGQLKIIEEIESNVKHYNDLLAWTKSPPSFEHFSAIVELCWEPLRGPGDRTYINKIGRLSARWLASFSFSYLINKSINRVINQYINDNFWKGKIPDYQERIDTASYAILHIKRHWFDYKLPKWISVVSNIQDYVFKKHNLKHGNYSFIASEIENGFIHPNLSALVEYDIPYSAIKKLENFIDPNVLPENNIEILHKKSKAELKSLGLLEYEIEKINNAI
jgi:hypothetical protein